MSRPHLVFVHGWGFGPDFWNPLRARLHGYETSVSDLGFFGPEKTDMPGGPLVAVGHSLGAPWLLRQPRSLFSALISLGGFGRFDVAPGPIRAMRRGLARDAAQVLAAFHLACGLPPDYFTDTASARPDRLAEGLDWLLTWDERAALASLGLPVLALAAEDDAVVPPALSRAAFPHGLVMLTEGGHAFPATRPDECARRIASFLENL